MSWRGMVSVWWLDLADLPVDAGVLDQCLTAVERARQARYRQPADRLRFAAGRALCRTVLARMAGSSVSAIRLAMDAHGRPCIESGADGMWFNLTHSGAVVALVVAPFPQVGIDTEEERPGIAEELAATVCTAREHAALSVLEPAQHQQRFFDLWTLKEAFMKATGRGMGIDPRQCEFDPSALPRARRLPCGDRNAWRFALWRLMPGQALSVCVRPTDGRLLVIGPPVRGDTVLASGLCG